MTFAELLARLGGMGRFQVCYVAALAAPLLMLPSHNLLQNFTAGVPEHHCRPRAAANGSAAAVPLVVAIPRDGHQRPQRCRRFVEHQWGLLGANGTNGTGGGADTEPCRDGWTYHDGVFARTIVTEWDLVCEAKALRDVAQSIYMAGVLLGSIIFGVLSDRWGRRLVLSWCYLQLGVSGTVTSVAPTFVTYCLCRCLGGMAMAGVALNSASLCMEWIPTGARAVVGTINGYSYTLGQFVLAGVAFALPQWRQLQLAVSLPFFLFFLYSWLLPESARWQVISGRPDLALKGLRKVARVNGRRDEGDKLSPEVTGGPPPTPNHHDTPRSPPPLRSAPDPTPNSPQFSPVPTWIPPISHPHIPRPIPSWIPPIFHPQCPPGSPQIPPPIPPSSPQFPPGSPPYLTPVFHPQLPPQFPPGSPHIPPPIPSWITPRSHPQFPQVSPVPPWIPPISQPQFSPKSPQFPPGSPPDPTPNSPLDPPLDPTPIPPNFPLDPLQNPPPISPRIPPRSHPNSPQFPPGSPPDPTPNFPLDPPRSHPPFPQPPVSPQVLQTLGVPGVPRGPGGAVAALIRSPGIRRVSGGVACVWFSTSFAYYGLAMDLQGFGVDVYVSQLLFAAVDVPAKLASAVVATRWGRRVAQGGSLALAGGCILANMLVPSELQPLRLTLAVIGKGALAGSFNCAYIFTGELFPTVIRQTGLGLGGTMARVGGMMAPLVRVAGDAAPALPPVIYGVTPALSALLTLLLPETRNVPLPETLRDLEARAGHPKAADAATVTVPLSDTKA